MTIRSKPIVHFQVVSFRNRSDRFFRIVIPQIAHYIVIKHLVKKAFDNLTLKLSHIADFGYGLTILHQCRI